MCSTNQAHLQYKRGCAVRIRHINQYKRGWQDKHVDNQVLVQGGTTLKYFPMNESLLLLIYQVKTEDYGRLQKSINYEILKEIFSF